MQYGAPLQYGVPVSYGAATMTVTGVDLNRDGMPGVLQQPQVSYAAPVHILAPAMNPAAPALVVQHTSLVPAAGYVAPAPATYGAPEPVVEYIEPALAIIAAPQLPLLQSTPRQLLCWSTSLQHVRVLRMH